MVAVRYVIIGVVVIAVVAIIAVALTLLLLLPTQHRAPMQYVGSPGGYEGLYQTVKQ